MLKIALTIFSIIINALVFNHIIKINNVFKITNYFIGLILIILSLPLISATNYWPIYFVNILTIILYAQLIKLRKVNESKKPIFNSGFITSLISIIDYSFIFLYVFILITLFYYKLFTWKNFIIQILGFICPILFYFTFIFIDVINLDVLSIKNTLIKNDSFVFQLYPVMSLTIGLLLFLSIYELYNNYYKKREIAKKSFGLLLMLAVFVISQSIIISSITLLYLLYIPVTIIIANYLLYIKNSKFRTFLLGLLIISFLLNFVYL